jgi:sulfur-carrier protein
MSIKVRYFASLKERLGRNSDELSAEAVVCVGDVWVKANPGVSMPDNVLTAVNMEYCNPDAPVADGDEVAFFPPVTGG